MSAIGLAHYCVEIVPPEPEVHHFWPSDCMQLKALDFYPDGFVRVLVAVPAGWRESDVRAMFANWGDCSAELQPAYPWFRNRPSVWYTKDEHEIRMTRIFKAFNIDCYLSTRK